MFFLGGYDLEMLAIRNALELSGQEFHDRQLEWGAQASAYAMEISIAVAQGKTSVLVELGLDIEPPAGTIIVDHHGDQCDKEASLLQVLKLLNITPSREELLIAANDSGYIPAMLAVGATPTEVATIRRLDRKAQGVTDEMERQAEAAITLAEIRKGVVIVRLPHTKHSPVCDRLFSKWPGGRENLVVVGKVNNQASEVTYFGRGDICAEVRTSFSGWGGGKGLGDRAKSAFAGCRTYDPKAVIDFVVARQ
jgi:hypothetical protein